MMSSILPTRSGYFQNGLQKYLEEFKYGNTESDDLWAKLTEAVKGTKREVNIIYIIFIFIVYYKHKIKEILFLPLILYQQRPGPSRGLYTHLPGFSGLILAPFMGNKQ